MSHSFSLVFTINIAGSSSQLAFVLKKRRGRRERSSIRRKFECSRLLVARNLEKFVFVCPFSWSSFDSPSQTNKNPPNHWFCWSLCCEIWSYLLLFQAICEWLGGYLHPRPRPPGPTSGSIRTRVLAPGSTDWSVEGSGARLVESHDLDLLGCGDRRLSMLECGFSVLELMAFWDMEEGSTWKLSWDLLHPGLV